MEKITILAILALAMVGVMASASIPGRQTLYVQTLTAKKNRYMSDGVFTGGKAGTGATVLAVRRTYSPKAKIERVIVDMGNKEGKGDKDSLGYFQVSMDSAANRLVLDLSQLKMTMVTEQSLRALFKKSPYVAGADFTLDPEDNTGSIVLRLKRPMKLEVFQLRTAGKPARVVLDLTPVQVSR